MELQFTPLIPTESFGIFDQRSTDHHFRWSPRPKLRKPDPNPLHRRGSQGPEPNGTMVGRCTNRMFRVPGIHLCHSRSIHIAHPYVYNVHQCISYIYIYISIYTYIYIYIYIYIHIIYIIYICIILHPYCTMPDLPRPKVRTGAGHARSDMMEEAVKKHLPRSEEMPRRHGVLVMV